MSTNDPLLDHMVTVFSNTTVFVVGWAASIAFAALCLVGVKSLAATLSSRPLPFDIKTTTTRDVAPDNSLWVAVGCMLLFVVACGHLSLVLITWGDLYYSMARASIWSFSTIAAAEVAFVIPAVAVIIVNWAIRGGAW